jgi:hypothetical protein
MKTLLYYVDLEGVNPYQVQLQLADKQVKLRDARMFNESVREHADEAYITPEVSNDAKQRIVDHLSDAMEVFLIDSNPDEIELNDTGEEVVELEDAFFEEPNEEALQADLDEKKLVAEQKEADAKKERAEAEAAELKAQTEEIEADQAEAEAEEAKQDLEDAEGEMTRRGMVTELRELDVKIPRNATKAQITELYNEHILNADPRD